jgi:hypothetical protein
VQDVVALATTPIAEDDHVLEVGRRFVVADNPPLRAAATALDETYDRLVSLATSC